MVDKTTSDRAGQASQALQASGTSPDISHIRAEIDRVDTALLELISERLDLAGAVRRAKSGARVWRPSREESHVRDLSAATQEASSLLVSRVWAELMSASLAIQGPMCLHIALEGDAVDIWALVRDRFGAALPVQSYPTASSALAAAYADPEGVAIVPAPGGMNTWWNALCDSGAMPDMHILAGLPRVGALDWPRAVAVATTAIEPSGADETLISVQNPQALLDAMPAAIMRAEAGASTLFSLPEFVDPESDAFRAVLSVDERAKIIGCLPQRLKR